MLQRAELVRSGTEALIQCEQPRRSRESTATYHSRSLACRDPRLQSTMPSRLSFWPMTGTGRVRRVPMFKGRCPSTEPFRFLTDNENLAQKNSLLGISLENIQREHHSKKY